MRTPITLLEDATTLLRTGKGPPATDGPKHGRSATSTRTRSPTLDLGRTARRGLLTRFDTAGELLIVSTTAVVSLLNYAYTLLLVWLLPARQYAVVGSASTLLLICGTISGASLPWVLAREVARARNDQTVRRAAVTFCVCGTLVEALVVGAASGAVVASYGSGTAVAAVFGSVVAIFSGATVMGYLQGLQSFGSIAVLSVAEVAAKLIAGVALVLLGAGSTGAITGFALGGAVVVILGGSRMLPDLRFVRSSLHDTSLWRTARGLLGIQASVAIIASLDIVVGTILIHDRARLAVYEVAQIPARIPVYIGTGLSMVVFPRLVMVDGDKTRAIRDILSLFATIAAPCALLLATLPRSVATFVFPNAYGGITSILGYAAIGGIGMGAINLGTTFFQAAGIFRRTTIALAAGVGLQLVLVTVGIRLGNITGLAIFASAGAVVMTAFVTREIRRTWPGALQKVARSGAGTLLLASPLLIFRYQPALWIGWAFAAVGLPVVATLYRFRRRVAAAQAGELRVLHLGRDYLTGEEDPALDRDAINRRLADHDITVVHPRAHAGKGARPPKSDGGHFASEDREADGDGRHFVPRRRRVEREGFHYSPTAGPPGRLRIMASFCAIPFALMRWDSDLLVDDLDIPFLSAIVPCLTRRPVVRFAAGADDDTLLDDDRLLNTLAARQASLYRRSVLVPRGSAHHEAPLSPELPGGHHVD